MTKNKPPLKLLMTEEEQALQRKRRDREKALRYYYAHREERAAYFREWSAKKKALAPKGTPKTPPAALQTMKAYYQKNRERILEKQRQRYYKLKYG